MLDEIRLRVRGVDDQHVNACIHQRPRTTFVVNGADRGRNRLLDEKDFARTGRQPRFMHGSPLDRRCTRRDADHDAGAREASPPAHPADEELDHLFGRGEVRDHTIAQRLNGLDLARRASEHALGFVADGDDLALAAPLSHGDDGGFVENDATSRHVNQRVRCT